MTVHFLKISLPTTYKYNQHVNPLDIMADKKGGKKALGKGLGALIRHYDLDEKEVEEAHKEAENHPPEKKKAEVGGGGSKDQEMGRLSVYKKALAQAHDDGTVSEDEKLMLFALRQYLMITEDEHEILEEQILRKQK